MKLTDFLSSSMAYEFMCRRPIVTPAELQRAGGIDDGSIWVFRDGSRGRYRPPHGVFTAEEWNVDETSTLTVAPPLDADELYGLWDRERKMINVPKLVFVPVLTELTISFHPDHHGLKGIDNIRQQLKMAIHRDHPDTTVQF
jgi:hypothetical protein